MQRLIVRLALSLAILSSIVQAETATPGLPSDMGEYVLALLYKGPTWSPLVTEESKKVQAGHMETIQKLVADGSMALAGPTDGSGDLRGIFIFNVKSVQAAAALLKLDPAIKAGRLRVELHAWYGPSDLAHISRKSRTPPK